MLQATSGRTAVLWNCFTGTVLWGERAEKILRKSFAAQVSVRRQQMSRDVASNDAPCSSIVDATQFCQAGFGLKDNAERLLCASAVCDPGTDSAQCCKAAAQCDSIPLEFCTAGNGRVSESGILCAGPRCSRNDEDVCCIPDAKCASFPPNLCSAGNGLIDDAQSQFCAGSQCEKAVDEAACCNQMLCVLALPIQKYFAQARALWDNSSRPQIR